MDRNIVERVVLGTAKTQGRPDLKPHEVQHLFFRRLFVFLDEWLTYALLILVYKHKRYRWFAFIMACGIVCNYLGYQGLWRLRRAYGIAD
jgi:hypothetical protein